MASSAEMVLYEPGAETLEGVLEEAANVFADNPCDDCALGAQPTRVTKDTASANAPVNEAMRGKKAACWRIVLLICKRRS